MAVPGGEDAVGTRSGRRGRSWIGWLPEVLVLLIIAASVANVRYDLGHRWFGLAAARPDPVAVAPAQSLSLPDSPPAPPVAVSTPGRAVDPAKVRAALAPYVGATALGSHVTVWVSDLTSGRIAYRLGGGPVTPASTLKLLTATAAMQSLGTSARFRTSTVLDGARVVLVGGGDPFLASSAALARGAYPARADLGTLAARTAAALRARGLRRVTLGYDDSLFTGPRVDPHWPATYTGGVVPPIGALWADEGQDRAGHYVTDPAAAAASTFAAALRLRGIVVVGPTRPARAGTTAVGLAAVQSAPLGEIVQTTLAMSDNPAAEVLARQVGIAVARDGSFAGAVTGVRRVLTGLGIDLTGTTFYDGSGLSRQDLVTPTALLGVLRVAAGQPGLREVITGLPVAGFSGSLQDRFADGPLEARGRVRAKTGTLSGVHGLAGLISEPDGTRLLFVAVADRVPGPESLVAQHDLDLIAGALGVCRCGSAS